jgi:hypothetical protein
MLRHSFPAGTALVRQLNTGSACFLFLLLGSILSLYFPLIGLSLQPFHSSWWARLAILHSSSWVWFCRSTFTPLGGLDFGAPWIYVVWCHEFLNKAKFIWWSSQWLNGIRIDNLNPTSKGREPARLKCL